MKEKSVFVFRPGELDEGQNQFELKINPKILDITDYSFQEDLTCEVLFNKAGRRIDLTLEVNSSIHFNCSKCGDPTVIRIQTSTQVTYLPEKHDLEPGTASDVEFYSDEIDISGIVRDAFLLAIPLAPLCDPDCKGLCPSCGINLNREKCDCESVKRDSPFEDLRRFIDG